MDLLEIDGSYGSGSGQILRTALALSILKQKPFHLKNIRTKRKNPGLQKQHMTCVLACKKICDAKVKGAQLNSKDLFFFPSELKEKNLFLDIGSAGSIPLVLQSIMPAMIKTEKEIKIKIFGGTDVKFAPSIDYFRFVFLKLLEKINYKTSIKIIKRGFYPKGGGCVELLKEPSEIKKVNFKERGKLIIVRGNSIVSSSLKERKVAERLAEESKKHLEKLKIPVEIEKDYVKTLSEGCVLTLWIETENSFLGACNVGEKGKSSEEIAKETSMSLIKETEGCVDSYAADQILPYIAYIVENKKEKIEIKTSHITDHTKTNAFIVGKFLKVKFKIEEKEGKIICCPD